MKKLSCLIILAALLSGNVNAKGNVKCVKLKGGDWELQVDGKPYFIKGVLYAPVKIGESPSESTMRDWMVYDENNNGKNDLLQDVWVDKNNNNVQDKGELPCGDFQILKDMGCNTLRAYHFPSVNPMLGNIYKVNPGIELQYAHALNKSLLREIFNTYGIRIIIGNFLGSWTIGAGTSWDEGCDYTNSKHVENIEKSVKAMVLDSKDEPYVLFWLLGNENNIATWSRCNAHDKPEAYYKMVNRIAKMIHKLDPNHPVAICEGYSPDFLPYYSRLIPDVDIIGYNAYMGDTGFLDLWNETRKNFDRPVFISEYGIFAYNKNEGYTEDQQLSYHKGCYMDILLNKAGFVHPILGKGEGNCIGSIIFDYVDRWYMDGVPSLQNPGTKPWGHSPDNTDHEEYFGVTSMGDGKDNIFKRQLRKSYYFYQEKWTGKKTQ